MKLVVLVGTVTGTAQYVAEEIELGFSSPTLAIETHLMDGLDASVFSSDALYLVCTSTYGQGDVPDNARGLFNVLERERPDLSAMRYGLIGVGDRTYHDTFCFGGKRFDGLLQALGAQRIGAPMWHDAASGGLAEDAAGPWMRDWLAALADQNRLENRSDNMRSSLIP